MVEITHTPVNLTDLVEKTTPATTDLLYLIDDPAGTPISKKTTVAGLTTTLSSTFVLKAGDTMTGSLIVDSAKLAVGASAVDANATLLVQESSASGAATVAGDVAVIERNGDAYLNFITGAANFAGLLFSDTLRSRGSIAYGHGSDSLDIRAGSSTTARFTSTGLRVQAPVSALPGDIFEVVGTAGTLVFATSTAVLRVDEAVIGPWASDATYAMFANRSFNTATGYALLQDSGGKTLVNAATGQEISFRIGNSQVAEFNSSGDFGIATTSPSDIFHVVGTGGDLIFETATGKLGIGPATPGQKLDVSFSDAGATVGARVENTSGTANSDARFICKTATSGGDPYFLVTQASGNSWAFGMDTGASDAFEVCNQNSIGGTIAFAIDDGVTNDARFANALAVGHTASAGTTAQLYVKQGSTLGAIPCLELDQDDTDVEFIEFDGTSGTGGANSVDSGSGESGACSGKLRITVNGTTRWLRFYADTT